MIYKLDAGGIAQNWGIIKYAAVTVKNIVPKENISRYCRNLLKNLLTSKYQCWFILSEKKEVKTVLITKIYNDIGDEMHLMMDVAYGFTPMTDSDREEIRNAILQFSRSVGCNTILAYVDNQMAGNALAKGGMTETFRVYSMQVGG